MEVLYATRIILQAFGKEKKSKKSFENATLPQHSTVWRQKTEAEKLPLQVRSGQVRVAD